MHDPEVFEWIKGFVCVCVCVCVCVFSCKWNKYNSDLNKRKKLLGYATRRSFLGGASGKESTCNAGDARGVGSVPGSGRSSLVGNGNLLRYSGNFHGQKGLAGYSPYGHKESDMIECTHTHAARSSGLSEASVWLDPGVQMPSPGLSFPPSLSPALLL